MRIAFVHPHFTYPGGAGRVVLELATRLRNIGHEVAVVSQHQIRDVIGHCNDVKFAEIAGPLPNEPLHYLLAPAIIRGVRKALKSFNPDVIVPNVFPSNFWVAFLRSRFPKAQAVWFCHEPTTWDYRPKALESLTTGPRLLARIVGSNPFYNALDRRAATRMDSVVVNSQFTARLVAQIYGRESTVVYPGVNASEYQPAGERNPYILAIGQLTASKNFELAIDAVKLSREELAHGGVQMLVVGDGPSRRTLEDRARRAGLESLVRFLGILPRIDVIELYSRAFMTLFTPLREPFGLVPLESMACGTPVVSVNSGGPAETIVDSRTGILTDPTPQAFAEGILKLIRNRPLMDEMGRQGREHVMETFTWEHTVSAFERALTPRHEVSASQVP